MSSALGDSEYKCSLCAATLTKAKKELKEDPDTRLVEVKTLRKRLEKVPGLKANLNFSFLLSTLRARKFDQEKAYGLVKHFYDTRQMYPELYDDLKPSRVRHVFEDWIFEVLEQRDNEGCRVIVIRLGRWDPDRYDISDLMKAFILVASRLVEEEETQVHGIHFIENLENLSWKQATHMSPAFAKKAADILQNVIPLRIKRVDYVNEPTFFDVVFAIFKQFIKQKLVKRLHLHGNKYDKLHAVVNPEYLPTDLGGKAPMFRYKKFIDDLLETDAQWEESNKYGFVNMGVDNTDAVSRSGDAGVKGLGGTFKKLDIN